MDTNVLLEIAKAVAPFLVFGGAALGAVWWASADRLGTTDDRRTGATGVAVGLTIALAGIAAVWLNTGRLVPGAATVSWIGVLACAAGIVPTVAALKGGRGVWWVGIKLVTLSLVGYIVMRRASGDAGFVFVLVGFPLAGLLTTVGLERATAAPGWTGPASMLMAGFAVSQVLIIGTSTQTPAWMAAGVSAMMGAALLVSIVRPRFALGPVGTAGPTILLCALLLLGAQWGNVKPWQAAIFGSILLAGAVAPLVIDVALGARTRPVYRLLAVTACAIAAVGVAVALRPPPLDY